jgi:hypothetical protein
MSAAVLKIFSREQPQLCRWAARGRKFVHAGDEDALELSGIICGICQATIC